VLGPEGAFGVVEEFEIARADIHGSDGEAGLLRIDAIEIHQLLQRLPQRTDIVEAVGLDIRGAEKGRDLPRKEEAGRPVHERRAGLRLVDQGMEEVAAELEGTQHRRSDRRHPGRRRGDPLPECSQARNALFRRVAGDDRRVDRPDRDASDPVRVQIRLGQGLIDPALIRAQSTAALEHQREALELRAFGDGPDPGSRRHEKPHKNEGPPAPIRVQRSDGPFVMSDRHEGQHRS